MSIGAPIQIATKGTLAKEAVVIQIHPTIMTEILIRNPTIRMSVLTMKVSKKFSILKPLLYPSPSNFQGENNV